MPEEPLKIAQDDDEWQELIHTEDESLAEHRLALFVSKYITPFLMVIVAGLFAWGWQKSTEVTRLRQHLSDMNKRIDELQSGIEDRSTQPQVDDSSFEPGSFWPISGSDP